MGYAMLYALMNLGGFLPGIISPPIRKAFDITGVFWVYVALTFVGIMVVFFFITNKAMAKAVDEIRKENGDTDVKEEKSEIFENFICLKTANKIISMKSLYFMAPPTNLNFSPF